jgi:hypothetical protein
VLDPRKQQNLSILLGRLKLSVDEMRAMFLEMHSFPLEEAVLVNLQKTAPTSEEVFVGRCDSLSTGTADLPAGSVGRPALCPRRTEQGGHLHAYGTTAGCRGMTQLVLYVSSSFCRFTRQFPVLHNDWKCFCSLPSLTRRSETHRR